MTLVLRRAGRARGLLVAAATAALLAVVLLTALSVYAGQMIDSGTRAAVAAAPAAERTVLVTGSVSDFADAAELDATVADSAGRQLGGVPTRTSRAGYAVGQQLPSRLGDAEPDEDGLLLGSVVFLDDLPAHATLRAGGWPRPGGEAVETALAEPVAKLFGVDVGDRIPLADRRSGERRTILVTGVWQPRDPADPYWRLVPELHTGALRGNATYGPLVVHRTDFARHFGELASLSWLVTPDLSAVTASQLRSVRDAAGRLDADVARRSGDRLSADTGLGDLTTRLARSAVVARSALLVPALLLVVIAGYALLLVAGLLADQRRGENALLRARGGGTRQLAGLAAAEAGFVIGPALVLGAPIAVGLLTLAERLPWLTRLGLTLDVRITGEAWLVAAVAALGCGAALVAPSVRRGRTYVAEQQAVSRAARRGIVQRAGVDLALVVLAVLAWMQLRQYGAPLLGLDVDPVLVAAPTIGVLAATVLALRLLPAITGTAQWLAGRRHSFATLLGAWQAGRRPHAGTVLLLSLAVAVATLAICLEGTSQRSLVDQASHHAGADLRLVEVGAAPDDRAARLAATPGVATVLPVARNSVTIGSDGSTQVVMLDADRAGKVVRPRPDLTDQPADRLFDRLADSRQPGLPIDLPPGTPERLTGEIEVTATGHAGRVTAVQTWIDVRDRHGVPHSIPVADTTPGSPATRVDVRLPADTVQVYGFRLTTTVKRYADTELTWTLRDLAVVDRDGREATVDLAQPWTTAHLLTDEEHVAATGRPLRTSARTLSVTHQITVSRQWVAGFYPPLPFSVDIMRKAERADPVAALVTPQLLADIGGGVGSRFRLPVAGGELDATVAGVIGSVPGVADPRALVVDLDAVTARMYAEFGSLPTPTEWRLATRPAQHAAAARELGSLLNTELVDRHRVEYEPLGGGARLVLLPAALAVALLAALGVAVDARATARRRAGELAVLHTVGSTPRTLVRALVAEQALLAGLGVLTGLAVGVLVAWAMAPLLVLTPEAAQPVPSPVLVADPVLVGLPVLGLLLVAFGLAALMAAGIRRNLAVLVLGQER